jgi:hypothetical protein
MKGKLSLIQTIKKYLGILLMLVSVGISLYMLKELPFMEHLDSGGDNYWHYTNAAVMADMIEAGKPIGMYEHSNLGWPMMQVYQPLFYIIEATTYLLSFKQISQIAIHNTLELLFITLIPIGVYYMSRKFEFSTIVAGLASLFSITTIAGWGTSMEAFFNLGMATFAAGAAFFPFALGKYYEILNKESVSSKDIALSALFSGMAFLGHQLAGYALFISFSTITLLKLYHIGLNKKEQLQTLKRIAITGGVSIALVGFFLFPKFFTFQEYNAQNYALLRVTDDASNSFTIQFFIDHLFSGELLDSTNNFGLNKDINFRWAYNEDQNRLPILTISFLLGCLICLWKIADKKIQATILLCISLLIVTLSFDDFTFIRFLPAAKELPYLRLISFWNMIVSVIAAIGLSSVVQFFANKLSGSKST